VCAPIGPASIQPSARSRVNRAPWRNAILALLLAVLIETSATATYMSLVGRSATSTSIRTSRPFRQDWSFTASKAANTITMAMSVPTTGRATELGQQSSHDRMC
jgi:hypothetical protein